MGLGFLRQAQEVVGVALPERLSVSSTARVARRRTRGSSPASRSAPPSAGAGSCRRATAGRRGSRPTTSSAASRVQPPRKTASRAKSDFSSSVSRSYDHSIVARSVRCRSGASRAPPVKSGSRCSSRSRIWAGESAFTRAAASSSASGRSSRRRQISRDGVVAAEVRFDRPRPREEEVDAFLAARARAPGTPARP